VAFIHMITSDKRAYLTLSSVHQHYILKTVRVVQLN